MQCKRVMKESFNSNDKAITPAKEIILHPTTLPQLLAQWIEHGTKFHALPKHSRFARKNNSTRIIPSIIATQTIWSERIGQCDSAITATKDKHVTWNYLI